MHQPWLLHSLEPVPVGPWFPAAASSALAVRGGLHLGQAKVRSGSGTASAVGLYQCNVAFPSTQRCVGVWRTISDWGYDREYEWAVRMPCLGVGSSPWLEGTNEGGTVVTGMGASGPSLDPLLWVFPPSHLHPSGLSQLPFCVAWCRGVEEWGLQWLSVP